MELCSRTGEQEIGKAKVVCVRCYIGADVLNGLFKPSCPCEFGNRPGQILCFPRAASTVFFRMKFSGAQDKTLRFLCFLGVETPDAPTLQKS